MSNKIKFGTHHFPVGTLYTVKQNFHLGEKYKGIFEVQKVFRNGFDSYCVESSTPDDQRIFAGMNVSCNISHVETIVKRGLGPLIIINWGIEDIEENILFRMNTLKSSREFAKKYFHLSKNDIPVNRVTIDYIQYFYGKSTSIDQCINMDAVWDAFVKRFGNPIKIKTNQDSWYNYSVFTIVKKKALKKWFKQNQNRFLGSIKNAQEKYDEMMFNMDSHFDDYDGDSSNEQSDNKAPVDDIRDGRAMDQMESDFDLDRYSDYSFKSKSVHVGSMNALEDVSLIPITENSPGMDKLIADLKKEPNEKGNPGDF